MQSHHGGGRGVQAGRSYNGRSAQRSERSERINTQHPGIRPELPFLKYMINGRHVSAHEVQRYLEQFKTFCQQNYIAGLYQVFDSAEPQYPDYEQPQQPEVFANSIEKKIWEIDYHRYRNDIDQLEKDSIKLQAAIWGNMSEESKDKVRQTTEGADAVRVGNDPLNLIRAIRSTHLTAGKIDDTQNLVAAEKQYLYTRMRDDETVDAYYRRFVAVVSSLTEAANRAERVERVPDGAMQAFHFMDGLSSAYSDYKSFNDMQMINPQAAPRSAHDVYEAVSRLSLSKVSSRQNAYRQGVFVSQANSRGGRFSRHNGYNGRGGGGRYGYRSGRGACVICGDYSHWKNDCPRNTEIKGAIKEVRAESSAGGGKVGGGKTKN